MTVSKEELESRFTWTVDTDGNVEVTGLKDASYMRDGGILVLPNARDFIDAGIITAGHTASITNKTLWHMIWDKHSQDLKELDVSNNGNQKLILLPPDDSEYDSTPRHTPLLIITLLMMLAAAISLFDE